MDKILIKGGSPLEGNVQISGAKNSALPLLFSVCLAEGRHVLENVPDLADIEFGIKILESLGVMTVRDKDNSVVQLEVPKAIETYAPYDFVRKMRASILLLGPILSRFGTAKISLPGGCAIGNRPINIHLDALKKMGATIEVSEGYVNAECSRLRGEKLLFDFPTVGGTENILMAAALAKGETLIENAAREPEVEDLGNYLVKMGVEIEGLGTSRILVQGKDSLNASTHRVIPDRIEAGTFVVAALITKGKIKIEDCRPDHLEGFLKPLLEMGARIETGENFIFVDGENLTSLSSVSVKTSPYPGFPTDLQAQLMTLLTQVSGTSNIEETIFENRFMHVQELQRLGARIEASSRSALVEGATPFSGAQVMATDLRASASLVLAGLAAEGETSINRVYHLDRGYEKLENKIQSLGGRIERV